MLVTHLFIRAAFAVLLVMSAHTTAWAEPPKVVVSIKPLHSIVTSVMEGVASPRLIVKGGASPHDYAMRPSDAAALSDADLVFWIGGGLETFLAKPLEALAGDALRVTMIDHVGNAGDDPHIWLDPANARKIAEWAAAALIGLDPGNSGRYLSNTARLAGRLDGLDAEIRTLLATVAGHPYLVFHDAYGSFEQAYGLNRIAAVTVNPQQKAGAKRIAELRALIQSSGALCLFGEPQFTPGLLDSLIEGSAARIAMLDPLGAALAPGPEAYFTLMRNLANDLHHCLAGAN